MSFAIRHSRPQEIHMAKARTEEDAARYILDIFVRKNSMASGDTLQMASFFKPFTADGWRMVDFNAGLKHAIAKGWVVDQFGSVKLTEAGRSAA
jgi:hypothetical protein